MKSLLFASVLGNSDIVQPDMAELQVAQVEREDQKDQEEVVDPKEIDDLSGIMNSLYSRATFVPEGQPVLRESEEQIAAREPLPVLKETESKEELDEAEVQAVMKSPEAVTELTDNESSVLEVSTSWTEPKEGGRGLCVQRGGYEYNLVEYKFYWGDCDIRIQESK